MSQILVGEAARILNMSEDMVRYLDRTGQLPARRIGHIRVFEKEAVEQLAIERYRLQTDQPHWNTVPPPALKR
jgi:DNA-binding transcriptional MerR regulator